MDCGWSCKAKARPWLQVSKKMCSLLTCSYNCKELEPMEKENELSGFFRPHIGDKVTSSLISALVLLVLLMMLHLNEHSSISFLFKTIVWTQI